MRDIYSDILPWLSENTPFAIATVTKTWGSAPRGVGSSMAVTQDMAVVGSVSGGCIEGAVIEKARTILEGGGAKSLTFGVTDETAWSVGLTCGGKVNVFVEKHPAFSDNPQTAEIWQALQTALDQNLPAIFVRDLTGEANTHLLVYPDGNTVGNWGEIQPAVVDLALAAYRSRKSGEADLDGKTIFLNVFPRRDRMFIIGAAHISIPLVKFAKDLGFEVITIDPRQIFATLERFPVPPDQLLSDWPDEILPKLVPDDDTYAVLLTHDPKIDDVALHIVLKSDAAYIGALGSKKTHAKRVNRLQEAGFTEAEIARIHGPVGLSIGAKTPEEVALSIIGQIIKIKRIRSEQ